MIDATSDPVRARLDRVAGLSSRAPRADYVVGGLSFGAATLRRNPANGRWDSLTLLLAPAVAADGVKAVKPKVTTVAYPLMHWLEHGDFVGEDALSPGLYALIVDGALLSNPAWLIDPAPIDPAIDPAAGRALAHLRTSLTNATHLDTTCPVCPPPRRRGRTRSAYPMASSALSRERIEFIRMLGIDVTGLFDEPTSPEVVCPHTAMRHEAFRALYAAFPELAFEAAEVLIAAPALAPPRFVMSPMMMRMLIGAWLMGRAHPGSGASHGVARPMPAPESPQRATDDALLSPGQRSALAFAVASWGLDGPTGAFVPAMNDDSAATPVMAAAMAPPGVALVWPDGIAKPAPRLPEAAPPPRPPERAPAPKRAKPPQNNAPTPMPGQELMTPELRALGYSDAAIKRLLKDGTIERAGYGWFRWKG